MVIPTPLPGERLPTISFDRLPPEGRDTIRLIARGGPFPYGQDGVVFENRERLLPAKSSGYYHEYTVETPGSPDRGARRIIRGGQGELYYTDDHYASFKRVVS
jgi:ribonuclease T1